MQLRAAEAIRAGETLHLECNYDLENALLYSIKWYFGDNEFYRYVPKESPPTRVFPLPGVVVDISKSNEKEVTLNDVQRDLTGYYKCEVSADAPSFHTDIKSAPVIVIEEPKKPPLLWTDKFKYSAGETIKVNCTIYSAFPAPHITWYINQQHVNSSIYVKISYNIIKETDGLETVSSRLETSASPKYFKEGKMKVKCQANQFDLYTRSTEVDLEDDTPQLAHVLSPSSTLSHDHSDRLNANKILFFINLLITSKLAAGR